MTNANVVETQVSLDDLRNEMGAHSNAIISDILEFTELTLPETIETVTSQISSHIITFLQQKDAIDHEYLPGDGENSYFDNREKYRQRIGAVISEVLKASEGTKNLPVAIQNIRDRLQDVLENDFR